MLGRLSVALLLIASPALANDLAPAAAAPSQAPAQEYTTKKVCHTVEVAGSFIPRRSCVTKKVPVKKPVAEKQEAAEAVSAASETTTAGQKE
jgi:hypothetical protein